MSNDRILPFSNQKVEIFNMKPSSIPNKFKANSTQNVLSSFQSPEKIKKPVKIISNILIIFICNIPLNGTN